MNIQDFIDDHLSKNGIKINELKDEIEKLSLKWYMPNYTWDINGTTVARYMPWKFEENKYKTALSPDRFHIIKQFSKLASKINGIAVECGVYKGGVSRYLLDNGFNVYCFDTFEGIANSSSEIDIHQDGEYNGGDVSEYLNGAKIIKGILPFSFNIDNNLISFAHIDLDVYQPTYETIKLIYENTNEKGIIIIDDYGMASCPGVKKAVDEFLCEYNIDGIYLPTTQMVIIKGAF